MFNTSSTLPNTQKTNHNNIKNLKKTPLYHVQKQPTNFHKCSVFFNIQFLIATAVFSENTIKRVSSEEHNFSKTHLVKPIFTHVKKHLFQKKCHFWFWTISAETTIFIVLPVFHCFGPQIFWAKTNVHENAFFLPS